MEATPLWPLAHEEPFVVYELANTSGLLGQPEGLVYVGQTNSLLHRLGQHQKARPWWWSTLLDVSWTGFSTRREAIRHEDQLIRSLHPAANIVGRR